MWKRFFYCTQVPLTIVGRKVRLDADFYIVNTIVIDAEKTTTLNKWKKGLSFNISEIWSNVR